MSVKVITSRRIHHLSLPLLLISALFSPALGQTDINIQINGNQKYQTMEGFGIQLYALGGFVTFYGVNYEEFVPDIVNRFNYRYARVIVDPQDIEPVNDNASPTSYNWTYFNSNLNNLKDRWGVSIFQRFQYMQSQGLEPIPTPNFWPDWMLTSNSDPANRIRYFDGSLANIYPEVGEFWSAFCNYAQTHYNVAFQYLSMQNEPDFAGHTEFSPDELRQSTIATAGRLLAEGFNTRFISPDTGKASLTENYANSTFGDSNYVGSLHAVAYHTYDNGSLTSTDPYTVADLGNASLINLNNNTAINQSGKAVWMLEWVPNGIALQVNTLDYAIARAKHIHNNLTLADAAAYFVWNLGGNDSDLFTGKSGSSILYRKFAYSCGQYSRYIPVGAQRLRMDKTGTGNVAVSAFADNNQFTAVLINEDSVSRTARIVLNNLMPLGVVHQIETSSTRSLQDIGTLTPVDGNRVDVTVPARSVTTLTASFINTPANTQNWTFYR